MFRKLMVVLAVAALMAASACNSVTGPSQDRSKDLRGTGNSHQKDIAPASEEIVPGEGDGSGSGPDPFAVRELRGGKGRGDHTPTN